MPKIDLLPCPFCGEKDLYLELSSDFGADVVICRGCLATFSQQEITCEEDLIKAWNTRASGWIPCSEMMPEDGEEVLFAVAYPWDKGKKPKVALGRHYTKNGKGWWTAYYGAFLDYEVTRWMPLPEPPETEDKS